MEFGIFPTFAPYDHYLRIDGGRVGVGGEGRRQGEGGGGEGEERQLIDLQLAWLQVKRSRSSMLYNYTRQFWVQIDLRTEITTDDRKNLKYQFHLGPKKIGVCN